MPWSMVGKGDKYIWRGKGKILSISSNRMYKVYMHTVEYCPAGK